MDISSARMIQATIRTKGGMDKYPAKAHAQRVADKLRMENGLIVLAGQKSAFFSNSDQPRPFRQDRYFYYLTGCNEPGCYVTYDVEKDKLTLWLPPIDLTRVFYDGRGSTVEEAMELYDVDEARYVETPKGRKYGSELKMRIKHHHQDGGEYAFFKVPRGLVGKPLRQKMKDNRKLGLRKAMNACRAVKDEHEIALIRKANVISAEAHTNILKGLHKMKSEPEVEAVFMAICIAHSAKEQSYPPICGSGANAGQLHYQDNDQAFGDRQVLLVDAGAEWQHYASDVTRTMPLNAKAPGNWQSKEAEAVYGAVEKMQEECIKRLRPGKKFVHVAWHAVHMAIDALLELGILKGDHMEIFHAGTSLAFFPHGLGHHMGLEVHDVSPPAKLKHGKDDKTCLGEKKANGGGKKVNGGSNNAKKTVGGEKANDVKDQGDKVNIEKQVHNAVKANKQEKGSEKKQFNGQKQGGHGQRANGGKNNEDEKHDKRFARVQGAYRGFIKSAPDFMPRMLSKDPRVYSMDPKACHSPNMPSDPDLESGMIVTVEPGLYFNKFVLDTFFLNDPVHAKFIDKDVLSKYMHVGGVRIEDDILITKSGYENLTTAPKGEDALKVIRDAAKEGL